MTQNRVTTIDLGCVTAVGSNRPIGINSALASVIDDVLVVQWDLTGDQGIEQMKLYKTAGFRPNATTFSDVIDVSGDQYEDRIVIASFNRICYQLVIVDSCGNTSRSVIFCNLVLNAEKQGLDNVLTWHEFVGLGMDMEFVIEILNEDGSIKESYPPLSFDTFDYLDPSAVLTEPVRRYRLKAVSTTDPSIFAYSNVVEIAEKIEVLLPEAFTPNGDGLNDVLEIQGNFINTLQLEVYNRLGVKVYASANLSEFWDGMYQGKPVPQGAYSYIIQGTDSFGNAFIQKGTVLVLR